MRNKKLPSGKIGKNQPRVIEYAIIKIELKDSKISNDFALEKGDHIIFGLSVNTRADYENSTLTISVRASFSSEDKVEFLFLIVDTHFKIKQLDKFIANDKFTNKGFLEFLADLALSHTRGIQSFILKDTNLNKIVTPIVDLSPVADEAITT